ncbi:lysylphosphatidylglycerol synthase domain-containing protein [Aequorivita ciconiae]|nr:lysylphosphatidylglycerol synthase domain-containing protein [Aequorivita sp. H23M31]
MHKTKQYLLALGKVLVLVVTFIYIFYRLQNNPVLDFMDFANGIFLKGAAATGYFLVTFLLLALGNWYFEILKWQNLISTLEKIDFKTALKQSLASLTVSLATPNRIGEYGAKALFFPNNLRKKVLLLNFFSNTTQLTVTLLFGLVGMFYFIYNHKVAYSSVALFIFGVMLISIAVIGYFLREKDLFLKGFSITNIILHIQKFPNSLKLKIFTFSVLRYLIFSGMFYGMLLFFGAHISVYTGMALIFAMYLLVSIVPTIFIFDVVVRGGVAVWLFSFVGIPELTVLSTVLAMWIFNFVLPSILGSFYVLTYQPISR